jgi:hypothetical protein
MKRFRLAPQMSGSVNISDSVLIATGGVPANWNPETGEIEPPMADAFATPPSTTPEAPPVPQTVRRFRAKPRPTDGDEDGYRITRIVGGLPDWRHSDETKARARADYEAILAARAECENASSSIAPPSEATPESQAELPPETQPQAPPAPGN